MKIILKNNEKLHFIEIYLFRNGKHVDKKDHISKHEFVKEVLNIDKEVDSIIVEVPKGLARLTQADSIDRESNDNEYFLYDTEFPIGSLKLTISRRDNNRHVNCIRRIKENEIEVIEKLINSIV
jgi:hypothetical protein